MWLVDDFDKNMVVSWSRDDGKIKVTGFGFIEQVAINANDYSKSLVVRDYGTDTTFTIYQGFEKSSLYKIKPFWLQVDDWVYNPEVRETYCGRISSFRKEGTSLKVIIGWVDLDTPEASTKFKSYYVHYEKLIKQLAFKNGDN